MAFDGTVIANLVRDMREKLVGGRILKIAQPEKDELMITVKNYDQYRLFMSADAGLPLLYISQLKKESPITSPSFCMLLRKYLSSAKIIDISQPSFERVVYIDLEHYDEMGDLCRKRLVIEIMGKHSNIIFCDDKEMIIDSIKHVSSAVSSVREVLPGRKYFITQTSTKYDPLEADESSFVQLVKGTNYPVMKAIYMSYNGISPVIAGEVCHRAGIDPDFNVSELSQDYLIHLSHIFMRMMDDVREGRFTPTVFYKDREPVEFSSLEMTSYADMADYSCRKYEDVSGLLEDFYTEKNLYTRVRQKSADLRHMATLARERAVKKYDLQLRQLKDTEKRDKFKLYGELLSAYSHEIRTLEDKVTVNNYYTGEDIVIPLDKDLSAIDNSKAYFDKYAKLKRTYEALSTLSVETKEEIDHIESVLVELDMATGEDDLAVIRKELEEFGYVKAHVQKGKNGQPARKKNSSKSASQPLHYVTEDDFHIYVGRNNYQNDELTFKFANGGDWWFHIKGAAGSHVVLKTEGREVPDKVFEQAAALAAYYSSAKDQNKAEVDYLERKNVKKPSGARPGFVVYYTNYSMAVKPSDELKKLM